MKKYKKYRQGDLLIMEVDEIPQGLEPSKDLLLISGSTASHDHKLTGGVVYHKEDGLLQGYFKLEKKEKVVHRTKDNKEGEHKDIELPKGIYSFYRQREYLPEGYNIIQD